MVRMNVKSLLLGVLMALSVCTKAQNMVIKDAFVAMPDSLCPLLTEVNRADCVDFLESKMRARVTNRFGYQTEMVALNDTYLKLQMTESTTLQMKLLAVNDSTQVICMVQSACAPACDSFVRFFKSDWSVELDAASFFRAQPTVEDFIDIPTDKKDELENVLKCVDLKLFAFTLSADMDVLTVSLSTLDYMEKGKADKLKPFIRPSLKYVWKDGRFE